MGISMIQDSPSQPLPSLCAESCGARLAPWQRPAHTHKFKTWEKDGVEGACPGPTTVFIGTIVRAAATEARKPGQVPKTMCSRKTWSARPAVSAWLPSGTRPAKLPAAKLNLPSFLLQFHGGAKQTKRVQHH